MIRTLLSLYTEESQEVLWLNTARAEDALYVRFTSRHSLGGRHRASEANTLRLPVTSLRTLVGIIEDRPTLKASNLAGPLTAPGPDVVDEPLVSAASIRGGPAGFLTGFLGHVGFHRHLRFFERRMFVS
jgi:hypothetical protein